MGFGEWLLNGDTWQSQEERKFNRGYVIQFHPLSIIDYRHRLDTNPPTIEFILAVLLVVLTRIPLDGVEIIHPGGTVPIPAELGPGDRFHLFFSSDATRDGQSSDITDYNRFVQNVADSASLGSSEGISWFAVASTSTVNARDNAIVTSPVYNTKNYTVTDTDMELVATDSTVSD